MITISKEQLAGLFQAHLDDDHHRFFQTFSSVADNDDQNQDAVDLVEELLTQPAPYDRIDMGWVSRKSRTRITEERAKAVWQDLVKRFPILEDPETPWFVLTAMLSLAIDRGPNNGHLGKLKRPLETRSWWQAGTVISQMQRKSFSNYERKEEGQLIIRCLQGPSKWESKERQSKRRWELFEPWLFVNPKEAP